MTSTLPQSNTRSSRFVPGHIPERYWWNNFAKLTDYMALRVPVIAHLPPISEARHELERAGTAFFLDGQAARDSEDLRDWLGRPASGADNAYADRYTVRRQVADFAALFDDMLSIDRRGR